VTCTAYPSVTVTIGVEFRYELSGAVPFFGVPMSIRKFQKRRVD